MSGYLDQLADMPVTDQPGDGRTVGTLMFMLAAVMDFCLQPETWPVFVEWYSKRAAHTEGLATQGRTEMQDALRMVARIALSGSS